MRESTDTRATPEDALETREWLESLDEVLERAGADRARALLERLSDHARLRGALPQPALATPYVNSIPPEAQPPYPGDLELERRIEDAVRWNAMALVVRANRQEEGIGGHIATFASIATLFEVGFNHFFRATAPDRLGDLVYFQGHASPGVYARAFLEGRLPPEQMENFRHELRATPGLPSYPHPWLMPGFWSFPTVSMGLGPLMAIYQARFIAYLTDRGLLPPSDRKVWAFVGDGECDEPEALGALGLAARERLDNLILVVNCNLQRLDGPVRGNGKIIQELESAFLGAGWRVLKVLWGGGWDELLARDREGLLARRMAEVVDGQFQKYTVEDGAYFRKDFFGADPRLLALASHLSDDQLKGLLRGGHDPVKVHAAYREAAATRGRPCAVLALTVKGYGMGEAGEGQNVTHQQKKFKDKELLAFRTRFGLPLSDEEAARLPLYALPPESPERAYLLARRDALGGFLPQRRALAAPLETPGDPFFQEFAAGTEGREVSTTMAYVRMLAKLLKDEKVGRLIVPIVPDEARTFGMAALFRQCGIYARSGQLYAPVDAENLLYYREAADGQILEEGITEAGSMGSFIAAGTAYANHGVAAIPFFTFYSMFGFQRVGDLIWAAADSRCKGFLMGATSGRTTLAGEGLQHQDGNSHLAALTVPNLLAYDPAYAYELAVILQDGLKRMYADGEELFYYITVTNENYPQPPMPEGSREGILRGLYRLARVEAAQPGGPRVRLLGSGPLLNELLKAALTLAHEYGVASDVFSVTSFKALYRDLQETERWNTLHPEAPERKPYLAECLGEGDEPVVAASDYVKALCGCACRGLRARTVALGTDGFGRSDGRAALRGFFEVDARHATVAALAALARDGALPAAVAARARDAFGLDPNQPDPVTR